MNKMIDLLGAQHYKTHTGMPLIWGANVRNIMRFLILHMMLAFLIVAPVIAQDNNYDDLNASSVEEIDPPDVPELDLSKLADEVNSSKSMSVTRFVSDEFFVPLRETPCPRCKIVHWGIKSGTKVKLLDIRDGWGLVVTGKGYRGWMEEQFVVSSPAAKTLLVSAEAEITKMEANNSVFLTQISVLQDKIDSLSNEIETIESNREELSTKLSEVIGISSDPVALNQQNETLVKQNHILQSDNDVLSADIEILENDRRNQSFLYGGLTVFVGAMLAILLPRLRKRREFSEWG